MILRIITGEGETLETLLQLELKKAPTAKQVKQLKEYESRDVTVVKVMFNEGVTIADMMDKLEFTTKPDEALKAVVVKVK